MKFRYIYSLFTLSAIALITMSNANGRASQAGQGNTGAPGDETQGNGSPRTCITCHGSSASVAVDINLELTNGDGNVVSEYIAGQTYGVSISLDATMGNPSAYGFQAVALKAPIDTDGDDVSEFSNPSNNVKFAFGSQTGRTYAEQNGGASTSNTFTMDWTAPEAGSGEVSFYACGNGVNSNGSTGGDAAACLKIEFTENVSNSVSELASLNAISVFPNPTVGNTNVVIDLKKAQAGTYQILGLNGQVFDFQRADLLAGMNNIDLDLNDLTSGIYLFKLTTEEGQIIQKVVKQ